MRKNCSTNPTVSRARSPENSRRTSSKWRVAAGIVVGSATALDTEPDEPWLAAEQAMIVAASAVLRSTGMALLRTIDGDDEWRPAH
jgi:hypothetical protein